MIGHPVSVLFSFRCCIELLTSVPFVISNFIHYGRYLYDKVIDPLKTKLIHLICTLMVLLYNGMSAFQYCEATFAGINYPILDSLYVVMVTLSTVGYGVMMTLIVVSLAVLPSLLTDVARTLQKRNDGGGHVSKGSMPFILIVGSFRPEQVNDILGGFLDREHAESHLNVIFLDDNPPTEELKLMERNSMWGNRIQFLHGSVLRARYARAIFTISDDHALDHSKEDERNTVRLWSLYCFTVVHNIPIYTYNLSPSTAIYQKVAREIICVGEFSQYLLAMNCRCRGVSTLLINLLHQRQPRNRYDESWQAQYDDGSCNEIYMASAAKCLIGLTFADACWIVYKECQVILFAVKTKVENSDRYEILLNPRHYYVIKDDDLCVYMAESPKEIRDIKKMQHYRITKLPSTRHALLTGSRTLIAGLGQAYEQNQPNTLEPSLPLCYLLDQPVLRDDVMIESASGLKGHILVCLQERVTNIFKFIYNLRSPYLKPDDLRDIVILCKTPPIPKLFELLNRFPKLYFMLGNSRYPDDLLRAGVKHAQQVVVMSEKESSGNYEKSSDSPAM
ncbi:calcium-activated BK potassium channel alpha subunit-domain-containing protein [Chlamydoabsidia padenii]|nr:calcium-activated BK potassium channel alpha subunit-domain-containing protein [Chlamydoabsidia padenii]